MRLFFRWKQIVLALGLVFVFSVPLVCALAAPVDAASLSGIVPCGMQADDVGTVDSEENSPCTLCHLVIGVKRVVDWGLMIMTYFALMVIVAMGILYIISVGDTKMTGMAKEGLKATLYGFALMLLIWLFIAVVLVTLARPLSDFKTGAMWWQFTCSTKSNVGTFDNGGGGNGGAVTPPGGGGPLTCSGCSNIASYVQGNSSGVDPNVLMAILQAGEHYKQNPCTRPSKANGFGACGYSQVIPKYHHQTCGFSGSNAEFCQRLINDTKFDIDCGAAVVKLYQKNKACQGIKNLALCYNGGPGHKSCGDPSGDGKCYGDRVEDFYNSCKK